MFISGGYYFLLAVILDSYMYYKLWADITGSNQFFLPEDGIKELLPEGFSLRVIIL